MALSADITFQLPACRSRTKAGTDWTNQFSCQHDTRHSLTRVSTSRWHVPRVIAAATENFRLHFLTLVWLCSVSNNRKLMRLRREEMHEWTYFQHFLTFIIKNKPQNNGGQAIISGHKKYGAHFKTFTHIGWIATEHKATSKISRW